MHSTHINANDTTNHRANTVNQQNNNLIQRFTPNNTATATATATNAHVPTTLKNGNHENVACKYREHHNGNSNGDTSVANRTISQQLNGNGNSNSNSNSNGAADIKTLNGNNSSSDAAAAVAYRNGATRRDSTQIWTPLLANGGSNGDTHSDAAATAAATAAAAAVTVSDTNGVTNGSSNNNDWKDAEELNNLRNGLLHQTTAQQQPQYNNHKSNNHHHHHQQQQHNNHHHHQHHNHNHHQGNNNGSLMNGKNGLGLTEKYDEQDPLTGSLYKAKKQSSKQRPNDSDESDYDSDLAGENDSKYPSCGLFGCRPRWARRFASTHVFMVVFLLAYILQGMYMTYFVSVITTIEKLFQIKSRTTGLLLSASEMGQISTAMLLTYFAGRGHRPRWIACGMVLFSLAAFSCSLPHFIFGKQLIQTSALLNARMDADAAAETLHSSLMGGLDVAALAAFNNGTSNKVTLSSGLDMNLCLATGLNSTATGSECNEDRKLEQASHSKITVIVLCIFFASLLSSGIGQTAVATLGIPYIDDNVASQKSAGYIAITIGVRILGPASGFIVGSICARLYVNFSNPGFDASDPRWIGAWWLGPVMIGSLMMLSSIAMFSFPRQLRGKKSKRPSNDDDATAANATPAEPEEKPRLRDFPKTVRRQLSNDILMFRTASCVFHLLPIAGLYTFLPKYLETQFRLATYDANMIAAFGGILVMGVGIVISGLVILKVKPSARSVAAWIAFTALIYSAGMVILMFVGCNMNDFAGYNPGTSNTPALIEPACSAAINCTCDKENFAPICGQDGKIYISSCHAGCTSSELRDDDNKTVYSNCACIPNAPDLTEPSYVAVSGYCDSNCKNFILFILIFAVCVFMHSTSEVGSMLLVMRCTHPKDKAMAMGVIQSAIGLFGNVPCPIIYGAVVDSACLIWKTVCGKHGACSLYDATTFRHYFLGITAGIMFLAFLMDLVVWSKAHRIDIAPEDENVPKNSNSSSNDKTPETECKRSISAPDTSV